MHSNFDFSTPKVFPIGEVFVELKNKPINPVLKYHQIKIKYPSRLDSACTDPGKIYENSSDNIYSAGQINFCVDICKNISIKARNDRKINIFGLKKRKTLILHAVKLMQKALNIKNGFDVEIQNDLELRHCGLGSSASIIQGIGATINEMYGKPIKSLDLIRYLAGNHGEEIDGNDKNLIYVQSVGGSGICGHFGGGLIILTGHCVPIVSVKLPKRLKVVFGVPNGYKHPDAGTLIPKEIQDSSKFKKTSKLFSKEIAYRLLNEAIPELLDGNFKPMKDFIFDYRWDMGSIKNCSYAYPKIMEIAEKLRYLKNDADIEFVSLSTAGPGFFIITDKIEKAKNIFNKLDMKVYVADIYNDKYKILEKK